MKQILQANMTVLQAGKFRHRIQIVATNQTQDTAGGVSVNDNTVLATVWATIEALSGQEKFLARQFASNVSHSIFVRYNPALNLSSDMQVWYNTRQFQIEAVLNPDERHK